MIEPAMTPEEWLELYRAPGPDTVAGLAFAKGPHSCAAWCLHGQPFGFTRADVRELRRTSGWEVGEVARDRLHSLADRIEALLPPEEVQP